MSSKIGIGESEYETAVKNLSSGMSEMNSTLDNIKKRIANLNTVNGGFYTSNISKNVTALQQQINSIQGKMSDISATERAVAKEYEIVMASNDKI